MEALGAEVKGVWLVDFDNGSGYYCWRWPETAIDHFHGYEEGFERPLAHSVTPRRRSLRDLDGRLGAKKSLPLSSTTMKAGKSSTSIFQTASMPSSGYSSTSTFLMQSCARIAAGPPIEPR